jgi:hypothetical protein
VFRFEGVEDNVLLKENVMDLHRDLTTACSKSRSGIAKESGEEVSVSVIYQPRNEGWVWMIYVFEYKTAALVVVWAGWRLTGWWRSGVTATTLNLIVLTRSKHSNFAWPGAIIFVSSKEFGAFRGDGWPRIDGWANRVERYPPRRWQEC